MTSPTQLGAVVRPAREGTPSGRSSRNRALVFGVITFLVMSFYLAVPALAAPLTYVVNVTDDLGGKCTASHCSLRQALSAANKNPGRDSIHFAIPGDAVPHTIRPTTELPLVSEPLVIDGTTEPSFDPITRKPVIELDGSSAPAAAVGLRIKAGGSLIRGLVINRFGTSGSSTGGASGIVLQTGGGNVIEGNFIGTDAAGHLNRGNRIAGIAIEKSSDNVIGGVTAASRNVLSGNGTGLGISGQGGVATRNLIVGNFIGVDAEGDNQLGNQTGVTISQAAGNTVGGTTPAEANVISANAGAGISVAGTGSRRNILQGNRIGTDAAGTANFGNFRGVFFTAGALENTVGGTASGAANLIAFNSESGVHVPETAGLRSVQIRILGNSIHSNGIPGLTGLGIDLTPAPGVNPNDVGDADLGANRKMNYPVLTSAVGSAGTTIGGTLNSEAGTTFRVEFFASPVCDPSGYGEGKIFLGAQDVSTNASGNASFTFESSTPTVPGWVVAAVSMEKVFGNTSEFSQCRVVDAPADSLSWVVNQVADEVDAFGCTELHCTLREAMLRAKAVAGPNTITFDIAGEVDEAPHVITPITPLPILTDPTVIDGTSDPDYIDSPVIRVDGIGAGASATGFELRGGDSTLRGLSITRWSSAAVALTSDRNFIVGNWIGITPEGGAARAPGTGIRVTGADNDIGGDAPADRNVVATHEEYQVHLAGSAARNNAVLGNYLGTGPDGNAIVGEISFGGILVENGADANVIGVLSEGGGNRIRGTVYDAITIIDASYTTIHGNDMRRDWGAWNHVITIDGGTGTLIGGDGPFEGNVISGAGGMGVLVRAGSGHTIIGNSIFENGEQSIDLGPYDGVTLNDAGDGDSGPNGLQNFPVLSSAERVDDVVQVRGTLNTHANNTYRVDIYANYRGIASDSCEGSNPHTDPTIHYGELEQWLGSTLVTTDNSGNAGVEFTTDAVDESVDESAYIVATATAQDGSTSEGSACVRVEDVDAFFVEADRAQLEVNGDPWYLYGASTYHSSNRGGPNDDDQIIAMAQDGGLNTLRLGEMFDQVNGLASAPYEESDWIAVDVYLDKLRQANMRAILDLSAFRNFLVHRDIAAGGWTDLCKDDGSVTPEERQTVDFASISPYRPSAYSEWDQFISFVANRVNTVNGTPYRDDATIAVVSFAGEPNPPDSFLCGMPADTAELTAFYEHVFGEWKTHDPRHLLSNGGFLHLDWEELHGDADGSGIDWEAIFALTDNDVPTLHTYPARIDGGVPVDYQTPKVAAFLAELDKPWFTEEFGWRQEVGDTTRAGYFQWLYDRQADYGSSGAAFWNLGVELADGTFDVNPSTPETWLVVESNAP